MASTVTPVGAVLARPGEGRPTPAPAGSRPSSAHAARRSSALRARCAPWPARPRGGRDWRRCAGGSRRRRRRLVRPTATRCGPMPVASARVEPRAPGPAGVPRGRHLRRPLVAARRRAEVDRSGTSSSSQVRRKPSEQQRHARTRNTSVMASAKAPASWRRSSPGSCADLPRASAPAGAVPPSRSVSRALNRAPNSATPTEPPTDRKKVTVEVATPEVGDRRLVLGGQDQDLHDQADADAERATM